MSPRARGDDDYIKPLKSACFNMEVKKAPLSSSLKERIKLNKMITLSPKSGKLKGIGSKDTFSGEN
jgi:hypothetical protein